MNRTATISLSIIAALIFAIAVCAPLGARGGPGGGGGGGMMTKEHLGKMIYCDTRLSTPAGQSCQTCHSPSAGYADPYKSLPVSRGIIAGRYGNRNSPVSAYQATSPNFQYSAAKGGYIGGQFWDGRARDLAEQAKGPFLNPLEMNNSSKASVVQKVSSGCYSSNFKAIYGTNVFSNVENAYNCIADALAAYEKSSELNNYSSKYDQYMAGAASLTTQELRGLNLFQGAGCSNCHTPPVFTDFSYHNAGVPRNPENPFYLLPPQYNPLGAAWTDYGLGGITGQPGDKGKMKAPTLRNIAKSAPYAHNGYFDTLYDVVNFKNTRNNGTWPLPEVAENVEQDFGSLGLSSQQVADIVAFLNTLSDSTGGCGGGGGGCGGMGM